MTSNRMERQDKTRQDIYFSDPQIKNIKYIQIVMYDSYRGGNEGSSIILNRLSTCYPQTWRTNKAKTNE